MTSVRAVLWDADGVLQQGPADWVEAFSASLGDRAETVGRELFGRLDAALAGDLDMREHVAHTLERHGLADRQRQVVEVWGRLRPVEAVRELVTELRAAGVAAYLATNQDSLRADLMRDRLGYDELLDGSYYSCDLAVAKPSPAFWSLVGDDLQLAPEELVFVDDLRENVLAAREVGLAAVLWHHRDGVPALREMLAAHGVGA